MTNAFVIGPIGDRFAPLGSDGRTRYEEALEVYEKVILPACSANSVTPVRADQIAVSGEITEQVAKHLYDDELVIADVSGGNPNVMYELGLRHTRPHLTIQLGEYGQLPFDVSVIRTIMFSRSERGLIDARNSLTHAISIGLAEGPDQITVGRIWLNAPSGAAQLESAPPIEEGERSEKESQDDLDESGFLDRIHTAEESFETLTDSAETVAQTLMKLGTVVEEAGSEMTNLNASGSKPSARMTLITQLSKQLQEVSAELSESTDKFTTSMATLDDGVGGSLDYIEEFNAPLAEGAEGTVQFLESLMTTAAETRSSFEEVGQFASLVEQFGKMAKGFRRPSRQIANDLRALLRSVAVMEEWDSRARRLKSEKFPDL